MKTNITKLVIDQLCSNVLGEVQQLQEDLKNPTVSYLMTKQAMIDMDMDLDFAKHGAIVATLISLKAQNGEIYLQWAKENGSDVDGDLIGGQDVDGDLGVSLQEQNEIFAMRLLSASKKRKSFMSLSSAMDRYESFSCYIDPKN
jgi:hypothetical protein